MLSSKKKTRKGEKIKYDSKGEKEFGSINYLNFTIFVLYFAHGDKHLNSSKHQYNIHIQCFLLLFQGFKFYLSFKYAIFLD